MRLAPLWLVFALLGVFCAGCSEEPISESPFPPELPNTAYRVTVHQVYAAGEPVAVMKFDRDANGIPTRGTIVGKIHGWPFAHVHPAGDQGEGLFTYRTDFTVTRSGGNQLPEAAQGTRTVYFHPDRAPMALDQPAAVSDGQPIIRDSVQMFFSFEPNGDVDLTETVSQTWSGPFIWNGSVVIPPGEPAETKVITASYSPRFNGYVFR